MYKKEIAKQLHNEYEKYAKEVGWKTQESTQVPFDDLPKENKEVMLKMGKFVSSLITQQREEAIRGFADFYQADPLKVQEYLSQQREKGKE